MTVTNQASASRKPFSQAIKKSFSERSVAAFRQEPASSRHSTISHMHNTPSSDNGNGLEMEQIIKTKTTKCQKTKFASP